jgi:hypothetical protein
LAIFNCALGVNIVCPFIVFKPTLLKTWVVEISMNSINVEIFFGRMHNLNCRDLVKWCLFVPKGAKDDCLVGHPTMCESKRIKRSKPIKENRPKMNLGRFMPLNIVNRMHLTLPIMAKFTLSPT